MPLILRVDVDKPYGRATVIQKILSKVRENYWLPAFSSLGYLNHVKKFLLFLCEEDIKAHIYFRRCTLPPKEWINNGLMNGHKIGHHAENTQDFDSMKKEMQYVEKHFDFQHISSFTKHGSGKWKGGRNHYPLYEPEKYIKWAKKLNKSFLFGNGVINTSHYESNQRNYFPDMYWIDKLNGPIDQQSLEWITNTALIGNIVILIHPDNFIADNQVNINMKQLTFYARQKKIAWITI